MTKNKFYILLAVFTVTLYSVGLLYSFENDDMKDQTEYLEMSHSKISLLDAVNKAENSFPDMKVASAGFKKDKNGQPIYYLELVNSGNEQNIIVNGITGQMNIIKE